MRSLNDDHYEVRIVHNASGTDLDTEFMLGDDGFVLKYENVEDRAITPGIVHSRCEITTIWPSSAFTKLDTFLTNLATSEDGDYLVQVMTIDPNNTPVWMGVCWLKNLRQRRFGQQGGAHRGDRRNRLLKNVDTTTTASPTTKTKPSSTSSKICAQNGWCPR